MLNQSLFEKEKIIIINRCSEKIFEVIEAMKIFNLEKSKGFYNSRKYKKFSNDIVKNKNKLIKLLCDLKKKNKRIVLDTEHEPCFIQGNGVVNMNDLIKNLGYEKYNIFKSKIILEGLKYSYNAVIKTYPILKIFISCIIIVIILIIFFIYFNYKFRKFETINLVFS